ncbi:ABC transporter substrate-binding protein [Acuticoccus kandeliae]|uniref:ABC transporter substrate-binding protein n=1 Tax=Acuticoccus kandeliae TaxID=2073160 RepID=UPI001300B0CD|nr:ABC transporter substrate-binding protein [Acuticoccus kandeliae]
MKASLFFAVSVAAIAAAMPARAQDALQTNELAVVSWGGTYQEAQREAFMAPFAEATGIEVIEGTNPEISRTRAEVESGSPSFDIVSTNQAFNLVGIDLGLWVPIDYKYFAPEDLESMPESERQEFGVGTITYSEVMAYNSESFPDNSGPSSWKEFWDTNAFPGQRVLPWCDLSHSPLPEAALLADGVAPEDLYPIDIERAAKKLAELKDTTFWARNNAQASQMLASGEAVMGMSPNGRLQVLIDQGAPIQIEWNEGRFTSDVWYVLKGAPNVDNAMRFIAFASRPEQQAKMAKLTGNGPTNPAAFDFIDEETLAKLPNAPDNLAKQIKKNETWWKENREAWVAACTAALM